MGVIVCKGLERMKMQSMNDGRRVKIKEIVKQLYLLSLVSGEVAAA